MATVGVKGLSNDVRLSVCLSPGAVVVVDRRCSLTCILHRAPLLIPKSLAAGGRGVLVVSTHKAIHL